MGISATTQLGIGAEPGEVTLKATDIDGDGVDEYIMENDRVRVTLLTTGARVIEYYVKSKDDNVFPTAASRTSSGRRASKRTRSTAPKW